MSPWTLQAGSVIAASLITGLNSDLPGIVTAQVTENAYDSVTGRTLLIPQGSRLIGSYDSVVAFGQKRALVIWQRIVLPDGASIRIDNAPVSDTEGYSGLSDRIDRHTRQLLKGVALQPFSASAPSWGGEQRERPRPRHPRVRTAEWRAGRRADRGTQSRRPADAQSAARLAAQESSSIRTSSFHLGEAEMADLKLAMLPDRKPVKLTFEMLPDLEQALADYAAAYEIAYGKREKPTDLIPYMLWAFLESDREFSKQRRRS